MTSFPICQVLLIAFLMAVFTPSPNDYSDNGFLSCPMLDMSQSSRVSTCTWPIFPLHFLLCLKAVHSQRAELMYQDVYTLIKVLNLAFFYIFSVN